MGVEPALAVERLEKRVEAAQAFLVEQGLTMGRVQAQGLGEAEPVASEETEDGAQQNRRVEVAIYASDELQQEMLRRHGGEEL